ncbi:MAG: type II secretion system protein [Candidatus Omnitrophica bacterium]|nr:type II secretion system protein [Candidatus Omnitrophota bacterium]
MDKKRNQRINKERSQEMNKKGFTLLEILVVISVIAILIGIAVPRLKGMQDEANSTKAKSELKTLQTAIESYYIHKSPHAYPGTSDTIFVDSLQSATPQIIGTVALFDPFAATGTEYNYVRFGDNDQYYVIYSVGVNGNGTVTPVDATGAAAPSSGAICVTNGSGC